MQKPCESNTEFPTKLCYWHIPFIVTLLSVCGCWSNFTLSGGSVEKNPDVYHVGAHEWIGDSIAVRIYRTSEPRENPSLPTITARCRSCNRMEPALRLSFNQSGISYISFPDAGHSISARIHLHGSGIDTTFIQTQRPPVAAMHYFHLMRPLVGRVLVAQFAPLYLDSAADSVVTTAIQGDELNIFAELPHFYEVQHPNFRKPLYLSKGDAVRLY